MKEILKQTKGVTLIALVITIIVLIILAGVSITAITGQNGLFQQASNAKTNTIKGHVEEMVSVAIGSLQTENLGDKSKITPQAIADQVNEENDRTDVTAEGSTFPTNIVFEKEGLKVPVDITLVVGDSSESNAEPDAGPIYSVDIDESQIAETDLFKIEPIEGTASNTKIAATGDLSTLPQKEARIVRINPKYCNSNKYNPETGECDLENDTEYAIEYEGITDTLIIPYQAEIDGEMYKITEVNLSVQSYNRGVYYGMPIIENIILPNTVEKFTMQGSNENNVTRSIILSENMKEMPNITGCTKLTSITIPKNISRIENALPYSGLTEINVDPDNKVYSSQDGVLFNKNKTELIQYPSAKAGDYTVPDGVETIDDYAFSWCTELTSITIPSSVNSIGYWVFDGCERLTSINIMKPKGSFDNVEYWGIDEGIIKWNYQEENDKN